MTVSQTSLIAYYNLDPEKLKIVREKVLFMIGAARKPSNADLERLTNIRLSSICGRVNELCKDGLVEPGGYKLDPFTRHTVTWWKLTETGVQTLSEMVEKTETDSEKLHRGM